MTRSHSSAARKLQHEQSEKPFFTVQREPILKRKDGVSLRDLWLKIKRQVLFASASDLSQGLKVCSPHKAWRRHCSTVSWQLFVSRFKLFSGQPVHAALTASVAESNAALPCTLHHCPLCPGEKGIVMAMIHSRSHPVIPH